MATYDKSDDVGYLYKLFFYDCIWEKDRIIYPASNCNAICETDIATGETMVIGRADEKEEWSLFHGLYRWKNHLILSGRRARSALSIFNLENGEWSYINIEEHKKEWLNFREEDVFEYNGYLYIFPFSLVVLKVDISKENIVYLFYPDIETDDDMRGETICIEKTIYIPIRHKNKIYKFDLHTEQWEHIEVNTELRGIDTLCFDGRLFWMTGIGQMICSWDEKDNTSASYKNFPLKFKKLVDRGEEEGFWFCKSIAYGNSIYFVPSDANMLIEFNTDNCEMNELFIEDEWEEEEDARAGRFSTVKYMGAKKKDNVFLLLSNKNKNLIFIDMETKIITKTELKWSARGGVGRLALYGQIMNEGIVDLNAWLEYVNILEQDYKTVNKSWDKTVGRNIYASC